MLYLQITKLEGFLVFFQESLLKIKNRFLSVTQLLHDIPRHRIVHSSTENSQASLFFCRNC